MDDLPGQRDVSGAFKALRLEHDAPRPRGRAQGEHWREAIAARIEQCRLDGGVGGAPAVLGRAGAYLEVLERERPPLAEELRGIAEGAGVSLERVVALNVVPDGAAPTGAGDPAPRGPSGATPSRAEEPRPSGCGEASASTAIYFCGHRGPLLGQTWEQPARAEAHLRLLRIAPAGSEQELLVLTLAGCLGVAGINAQGVAITTNALSLTDARVGVPNPAVVRSLLEASDARAAHERLLSLPLARGAHYIIADGQDFYGVETSAELKVLTQLGPRAAHLHTNHCFDPVLRKREAVPAGSTTFARLNLVTTLYAQRRPVDADGMWNLLHARDGTRGSPIGETGSGEGALATGAVIMMRLHDGWVRVQRGGDPPTELAVGRFRGQPPADSA